MDFFWWRHAAKIVAGWQPASILDLATGSGDLALTLRKFNKSATVAGADFSGRCWINVDGVFIAIMRFIIFLCLTSINVLL